VGLFILDYEKLVSLAKPYLEKNDLGSAHTSRVLAIAKQNFVIPNELEDLIISSIILHDIGGSSIKEQYEKGPQIAALILGRMEGVDETLIERVCKIVGTHHDHPDEPSVPFRILYDSDKIVMFSPEEFKVYDARISFDWDRVIDLMYSDLAKKLAREMLMQRREKLVT
jgi:hypothetical protein